MNRTFKIYIISYILIKNYSMIEHSVSNEQYQYEDKIKKNVEELERCLYNLDSQTDVEKKCKDIPTDANIFFFIGPSQTGKSTLINMLRAKKTVIHEETESSLVNLSFIGLQSGENKMGDGFLTGTKYPEILKGENDGDFYIDTPGFEEDISQTNFESYMNMRKIGKILQSLQDEKQPRKITVILVLKLQKLMEKTVIESLVKIFHTFFPELDHQKDRFGIVFTCIHQHIHLSGLYSKDITAETQFKLAKQAIQKLIFEPTLKSFLKNCQNKEFSEFVQNLQKHYLPACIFFINDMTQNKNMTYSLQQEQLQKYIQLVRNEIKSVPSIIYKKKPLQKTPLQKNSLNQLNSLLMSFNNLIIDLQKNVLQCFHDIFHILSQKDEDLPKLYQVMRLLFNILFDLQADFLMQPEDQEDEQSLRKHLRQLHAEEALNKYYKIKYIAEVLNSIRKLGQKLAKFEMTQEGQKIIQMIRKEHKYIFRELGHLYLTNSLIKNIEIYKKLIANELATKSLSQISEYFSLLNHNTQRWWQKEYNIRKSEESKKRSEYDVEHPIYKSEKRSERYDFITDLKAVLTEFQGEKKYERIKLFFTENQNLEKEIIQRLTNKRYNLTELIEKLTYSQRKIIQASLSDRSRNIIIEMLNSQSSNQKLFDKISKDIDLMKIIMEFKELGSKFSSLKFKVNRFESETIEFLKTSSLILPFSSRSFNKVDFYLKLYEPYLYQGLNQLVVEYYQNIKRAEKTDILGKDSYALIKEIQNFKKIEVGAFQDKFSEIVSEIIKNFVLEAKTLKSSINQDLAIIRAFINQRGLNIKIDDPDNLQGKILFGRDILISQSIKTDGEDLYIIGENVIFSKNEPLCLSMSSQKPPPKHQRDSESKEKPRHGIPGQNSGNGYFMYMNIYNQKQTVSLEMSGGRGGCGEDGRKLKQQKQQLDDYPFLKFLNQNVTFKKRGIFKSDEISEKEQKQSQIMSLDKTSNIEDYDEESQSFPCNEFRNLVQMIIGFKQIKGSAPLLSEKIGQIEIGLGKDSENRKLYVFTQKNTERSYLPQVNIHWRKKFFFDDKISRCRDLICLKGYYFMYIYAEGRHGEPVYDAGDGGYDGYNGILISTTDLGLKSLGETNIGNDFKKLVKKGQKGKEPVASKQKLGKALVLAFKDDLNQVYGFFQEIKKDPKTFKDYKQGDILKNIPDIDSITPTPPKLNPLNIISIKIMGLLCQKRIQGFQLLKAFLKSKFLQRLCVEKKKLESDSGIESILDDLLQACFSWLKIIDSLSGDNEEHIDYMEELVKSVSKMLHKILLHLPKQTKYQKKIARYELAINYFVESKREVFKYVPILSDIPQQAEELLREYEQYENKSSIEQKRKERSQIIQKKEKSISSLRERFKKVCQEVEKENQKINNSLKTCINSCIQTFQNQIQKAVYQGTVALHRLKSCHNILNVLQVISVIMSILPGVSPIGKFISGVTQQAQKKITEKYEEDITAFNATVSSDLIQSLKPQQQKNVKAQSFWKSPLSEVSKNLKKNAWIGWKEGELKNLQDRLGFISQYLNSQNNREEQILHSTESNILKSLNQTISGITDLIKDDKINYIQMISVIIKSKEKINKSTVEIKQQLEKLQSMSSLFTKEIKGFDKELFNYVSKFECQLQLMVEMVNYSHTMSENITLMRFIGDSKTGAMNEKINDQIMKRVNQNEREYLLRIIRQNVRIRDFPFPLTTVIEDELKKSNKIKSEFFKEYCKKIKHRFNDTFSKKSEKYKTLNSMLPCYHWTSKKFGNQFRQLFSYSKNYTKFKAQCLYWDKFSAISMTGRPQFIIYHEQPRKLFLNNQKTLERSQEIPPVKIQRKQNITKMQYHIKSSSYFIDGPKDNCFLKNNCLDQKIYFRSMDQFQKVYSKADIVSVETGKLRKFSNCKIHEDRDKEKQDFLYETKKISPYCEWQLKIEIANSQKDNYTFNVKEIDGCILRLQAPCNLIENNQLSSQQEKQIKRYFSKQFIKDQGPYAVKFSDL